MEFTGERLIPEQAPNDLYHEHLVRYMFAAPFCRGRAVLDAGCGVGYGSALLAASGALSVLGVDVAAAVIDYAQQRYQAANLAFARHDVTDLPLPAASFDVIVSFEVIEHIAEPAQLVRQAAALLRPSGVFVLSTPNPATYPPGNPFHTHELTWPELAALLEQQFPAVARFEQDYATALVVRPEQGASGVWTLTPAAARAAQEPDYFLAVCAQSAEALQRALANAQPLFYELPADRLGERIRDLLAVQSMLDEKNRHLAEKAAHIARLETDVKRQADWAAGLERRLQAIESRWFGRLLSRLSPHR